MPLPNEESILEEAQRIIYGDREKTYGHPAKNLKVIAALWTAYITETRGMPVLFTLEDVCSMMVLLKLARLANDPKHRDSKVDVAGYIALMQRCQDYDLEKEKLKAVAVSVQAEDPK